MANAAYAEQPEDVTPTGVSTWGKTHAALRAAGRAVDVVVVGRGPERLAAVEPLLAGWTKVSARSAAEAGSGAEAARAEFAEIQAAVAHADLAALEAYGGINGAL